MSDPAEPAASPPEEPKMEVHHKPKPVRNWREFFKEYAIIVLGVLTALGAEQVAEWLHWREQVAEARITLGNELGVLEAFGLERVRLESCIETRLDTLANILDQGSRSGKLPPVPEIGRPPIRTWPDDVWQNAIASGTAIHFSAAELNVMAFAYAQGRGARDMNREEQVVWASLYSMVGPGRRLDPASEAALRDALSKARYYNRNVAQAGGQSARRIGSLDLPHDSATQARIDAALNARTTSIACQPLPGQAPLFYGQAQLDESKLMFRDWQKYPPYAAPAAK